MSHVPCLIPFRTFAQRNVLPLLGLIPLLLSIATFVYDYYSDVDLTVQYHEKSSSSFNSTSESNSTHGKCYDFDREPNEYLTAFVTNLIFIGLPVAVFVVMGARELLPLFDGLVGSLENRLGGGSTLYVMALYPVWILVSVICAPFFILYVAARNVYYKVCTQYVLLLKTDNKQGGPSGWIVGSE